MNLTPSRISTGAVAITAAAALALAGCSAQDTPSIPASTPTGVEQPAPEPAEEPSCEASDIAEGDYLQDCFGVGHSTYAPKPEPSKASPTPTCKSGHKIVKGKCVKTTSARR